MKSIKLSAEDLARLVRRIRKGDDAAWSALVDELSALVFSVPRRMGLSRDDADDIFQETFLRLHQSVGSLEDPLRVAAWAAGTAANLSLVALRSRRRRRINDAEVLSDDAASAADPLPDEEAASSLLAHAARTSIAGLPEKCRDLLTLVILEEADYQEISSRLGIPVGSIGPTRARCLDKLRKELASQGFSQEDVS